MRIIVRFHVKVLFLEWKIILRILFSKLILIIVQLYSHSTKNTFIILNFKDPLDLQVGEVKGLLLIWK